MPNHLDLPAFSVLSSAATRCGIDLHAVMQALEIEITANSAPFGNMPLPVIVQMLEQLHEQSTHGHFPLAFADVFQFDGQPAVSAFLASANRLRDMDVLLEWVPRLIHPAIHFDGVDDGQTATLEVLLDNAELQNLSPLFIELISAVVLHIVQRLSPQAQIIKEVHFQHHALAAESIYSEYFGCPICFAQAKNQLLFDSRSLDRKLPGSLPSAHAEAAETIRNKLVGDGVAPPLVVLAQDALKADWGLFESGVQGLADKLKLHPRTLQRRLRADGWRYSDLLSRTRHELACQMLRESELDIESIGIKLGFSERRSFTLAFKSWQGQTPSQFRRSASA